MSFCGSLPIDADISFSEIARIQQLPELVVVPALRGAGSSQEVALVVARGQQSVIVADLGTTSQGIVKHRLLNAMPAEKLVTSLGIVQLPMEAL